MSEASTALARRPVPRARSLRSTLREVVQLAGLFLHPSRGRARALYDFLGTDNNLGEETLFLNLGYWKDACRYDDACRALAALLAEAAQLSPTDRVVDCGCGFGDQDALWLERYAPAVVVGLNVNERQLRLARSRLRDPRFAPSLASATSIPLASASFDKVLSLESAFHFEPRTAFFREAYRVLRPGGVLSLTDIVPARAPRGLLERLAEIGGCALWQLPRANLVSAEQYRAQLEEAGFRDVDMKAIGEHVYAPFDAYARERLDHADVRARMNPALRALWKIPNSGTLALDYLLVVARKPGA